MKTDEELKKMYSMPGRAYFKPGLGAPVTVCGIGEHEAKANALAHYRKGCTLVSLMPMSRVVDHVEFIG